MDIDDIPLESLQAQIDMSMSFAQSLVSSWVKPSKLGSSRKRLNLETELLEATHRRPRLGVGAAVPDASTVSRDTVRLKGQLVGGKRGRGQEHPEADMRKVDEEDEEESRAGAIKKAKLDPFDKPAKKKGGAGAPSTVIPSTSSTSKISMVGKTAAGVAESAKTALNQPEQPTQSSSKKKKKTNKLLVPSSIGNPIASGSDNEDVETESAPAPAAQGNVEEEKGKAVGEHLDLLSTTSGPQRDPSQPSETGIKLASASLIRPRELPSPSKLPSDLLKKPLLNLQEISEGSDSEDDAGKSIPTSPKKKRRRRKKKKATIDTPTSPTSPSAASASTIKLLIS